METRNPGSFVLAFDNTNGLATGFAVSNVSGNSASVVIKLRDDTGALLQTTTVSLPPQGQTAYSMPFVYPVSADRRGTVELVTPPGGQISTIGIRVSPEGTLTTVPVFSK